MACQCREQLLEMVSTHSVNSINGLCLPPPLPRRRLKHRIPATADEETGQTPTDLRADRSTRGAFELTVDALGFVKGGLHKEYHELD